MKKKSFLFRLVVVVLVCTMLLGLMGVSVVDPRSIKSNLQKEALTTEPANNETQEQIGETESAADPVKDEESKPDESDKDSMKNALTVTLKQPEGGTLELVDPAAKGEVKEDGSVVYHFEKGVETWLKFSAKGAGESEFLAAYVATGDKAAEKVEKVFVAKDGTAEFKVVALEENLVVSAEFFGIISAEVSEPKSDSSNGWANAEDGGRTVTVKTVNATEVALMHDKDYIKAEDKGNGVFEVVFTDQLNEDGIGYKVAAYNGKLGLKDDTKITVNKIDTVGPVIEGQPTVEKDWWGPFDKVYINTVSFADDMSGIDKESIVIKYDTKKATNKIYTPKHVEWTGDTLVYVTDDTHNFYYEIKDNAGNLIGKAAAKPSDIIAPFIIDMSVVPGALVTEAENNEWWAGSGAKLTVKATDGGEVKTIWFGETSADAVEVEEDNNVYSADFAIEKGGTFEVKADDGKNVSEATEITIKYDPDAPTVVSAEYVENAYEGDNWLKYALNKISLGMLFNNGFRFNVDATDDKDADGNAYDYTASGVYAYAYKLVDENEKVSAPSIRDLMSGDKTDGWKLAIPDNKGNIKVSEVGDFTGYVYLCVWDNAENCSMVVVSLNGEGEAIITNEATENDTTTPREEEGFNPALTVMAKSKDSDGKEFDYVDKDNDGNPVWVKSVDFKIGFNLPELEEGSYDADTAKVEATYKNYYSANDSETETIDVAQGQYADLNIGESGRVSISGVVTFTLYCDKITPVEDNPETTDIDESGENKERVLVASTSVPVYIQNFLNTATITTVVNDVETAEPLTAGEINGWYNAQNNVLDSATINGCVGSIAPFETHYKVYYQSYQDYVAKKSIEKADLDDSIVANNSAEAIAASIKDKLKSAPGVYFVKVWSEDAAGNYTYGPEGNAYTAENPEVYTFMIDEDQPTISAIFTGEEAVKYYKDQRIATIVIHDTSFNGKEDAANMFFPNFVGIDLNGNDSKPVEGVWTFNDKECSWSKEYTFGNKENNKLGGRDGDDYKLTVKAVDNAGNWVSTDEDGNMYYDSVFGKNADGTKEPAKIGAYTKIDTKDFRMDQTAPVVTVEISNDSVLNERYFNKGRIATITVVDHNLNYDSDKQIVGGIENKITGNSDGVDISAGWVSKGNDTYVKTVEFLKDNNCTFGIRITDMAGNTCEWDEVTYKGVAPKDFVIDLTNPALNVDGTSQTPYPDACTPGFTGKDTNISSNNGSAEYTVRLTRTVREHRNEDVTARFASSNATMSADQISAIYANIPDDAANDGIYTLSVSVTDLAGNSTETSSTFTVNRHGSFYIFNDALSDVVNARFVQKADGKYSVTEYNASPLVADSVKIEIYRDGQLVKTLTPAIGAASIGASGLYEYTYDLPAENFAQDGRYSVCISSEDEAKNLSDNTKLEDAVLEFTVDSVDPEIAIIKGLEKARVNAEELEITAGIVDTYGIADIKIIVDGEIVKEYVTQDAYDELNKKGEDMSKYEVITENLDFTAAYTLLESNSKQNVEIVVTDMAGNSITTAADDFDPVYDFHDSVLVSTSFFARYIHNPVALTGTGVVIAGAIWFVLAKKKESEKEAA